MKTHIDNIPFNTNVFIANNEITKKQLQRVKSGDVSRCQLVAQVASAHGKAIGQFLVKPGTDDTPWKDSAIQHFAPTLNSYLDASGLTEAEMGLLLEVSSIAIANYRKGEFFPNLERIQLIADTLGIEISDLFLPVRDDVHASIKTRAKAGYYGHVLEGKGRYSERYAGFFSHRAFLAQNIIRAMRSHGVDYLKEKIAARIIKGQTVRVNEIEQLSRRYGLSIGDAFLRPEVKTTWYTNTRMIYLAENVQAHRKELGLTREELVPLTSHCNLSTIITMESGNAYSTLAQTQDVANALGIEISDLFLPIDGLD